MAEPEPGSPKSGSRDVSPPGRLLKRSNFKAASRGKRFHASAFSLQVLRRPDADNVVSAPRVGYTVTRKVGTSTERNRIRRRLREAIRTTQDLSLQPFHDYVLVAKRDTLSVPFIALIEEMRRALAHVHRRDGKTSHS